MLRCTPPVAWVALALWLAGCGPVHLAHLGAGPFTPGRAELFDRALAVSSEHGYHPSSIDRTDGTFVVSARRGAGASFTVRCLRDGWISVEPSGRGVEEEANVLLLPRRLRDEYLRYVAFLQDEIGVIP